MEAVADKLLQRRLVNATCSSESPLRLSRRRRALRPRGARKIEREVDHVIAGLEVHPWPARLERMRLADGRLVLLDAAHNAEGAAALSSYLGRWHPERPAHTELS